MGFPGETDDDLAQLLDFLEEMEFERVGAFSYSPQAGTRSAKMPDDVPDDVKRERLERVQELQRQITAGRYETRVGERATVLVEAAAKGGHGAIGRLPWQADDIDGITTLDCDVPPGAFAEVRVLEVVDDYDFRAQLIALPDAQMPRAAAPRTLPLLPTSIGSFGR